MKNKNSLLISLHGGHSGQFCDHAKDSLEDIIISYIQKGFSMVGISEHIPPMEEGFLFPEEKEAGHTIDFMQERFHAYMEEVDRLSLKYADKIIIYKGMETEAWPGYENQVRTLCEKFEPDYIVGSVHHINGISIDFSTDTYREAAVSCGGISAMYLRYFDVQYEMIKNLRPFVVGHFDLIRLHDPDYVARMKEDAIREKIHRNLSLIKDLGLAMDFNLRPLVKGAAEPYPTKSILKQIRTMEIPMIPGDDSHGADQAGGHVEKGIAVLQSMGFTTNWPLPPKRKDK